MRRTSAIILTVAALAALLVTGQPKAAKSQAKAATPATTQAKPAPRMPDGKPDLSGFWQGPLLRNMFESVGGPPFTPAGEAAYRYNMTQSINPEGLCLFAGVPRASISGVPFEILQNSKRLAFLYELMTAWRSIPLDGSPQPPMKDIEESYFGHGIGRWEGDTLVIDSIGFKDKQSWVDDDAHPHSDAMHVVERWSRPDWDHLKHDLWVEDPKFYTKPWTFTRVFTHMAPGKQPMEYACTENNKDLVHGLGFGPQREN
jgi:hypothetical protein